MKSRFFKTVLAACLVFGVADIGAANSDELNQPKSRASFDFKDCIAFGLSGTTAAVPPAAVPPGMVPMIVYVPAQQMQVQPMVQSAPVPPHSHTPQAAQTIDATHCSINDVAVLTQDAPSCEKAGGKVVAERASFGC